VLHKALADAMKRELLFRNPADLISPPKVTTKEMKILDATAVTTMLEAMRETPIFSQIVVLLSTGIRRGELFGLQWKDLDLDGRKIRVERSVEKTKAGLRIKSPKTTHGRRLIRRSCDSFATAPESHLRDARGARRRTSAGRSFRIWHNRRAAS
jgi:integrase